jgi:hypothetical protein
MWVVSPTDLVSEGVAMGETDDDFVDGWYEFTYTYTIVSTEATNTDFAIKIVDGVIRNSIYDLILEVPDINTIDAGNKYDPHWYEVTYPIYLWSIYQGMLINPYSGRKNKVLRILKTLQQMV